MKTKCFAILIAFCLLIAHASAQPYSIRANRGLNLRTEPSLNASIAETIHSGTVLQVVGKLNRWLKIDRNGREVWLADWVNFSRVESGAPSGSQQPTAQIDNCCFVNRQCATNQEWTDGYWAYQRNECPSGQPVAPVSAPVSAPAGQPIDNCCFVNRQCVTNQEWIDGYMAYQNGQCAAPGQLQRATPSGSLPRIEGSDIFIGHIIASLNWLKRVSPEWYNYIRSAMDLIVEVPTPVVGTWVGGEKPWNCTATARVRERTVTMETCWLPWTIWGTGPPEFDQMKTVGVLAHEACHIHLHEAGIHFPTQDHEETECNKYFLGADVALRYGFIKNLDPSRGSSNWWDVHREDSLAEIGSHCADKSAGYGFRPELFCATLRVVQSL